MQGKSATKTDQLVLSLTVLSGPDAGMSRAYRGDTRISMGRDVRNDFVLNDGFVSSRHGELVWSDGKLTYRDLCSRHGSLVLVDDVSLHLQNRQSPSSVKVTDGAELQLGSSLIRLDLGEEAARTDVDRPSITADDLAGRPLGDPSPTSERVRPPIGPTPPTTAQGAQGSQNSQQQRPSAANPGARSAGRETLITTALRPVQSLTSKFGDSDRMGILFRLAGQLNSLTKLDDILDLIVEATFDAFPAANFFAMTLAEPGEDITALKPYLTRVRGHLPGQHADEEPILSTSILRRVIDTRESVLFVKDSLGDNVSQSILDAQITACLCAPLVGQRSLLGVMQVDTRGRGSLFSKKDLDLFSVFASNAAFALERAQLSENIVEMFESFVAASVNAIEARDPTTAGHSERVAHYTLELARTVDEAHTGTLEPIRFQPRELKELRYAALLHDFGKIAVREDILRKGKRLPELHLELIEQRFETIKALEFQRHIRKHFGGGAGVGPDVLGQLETRYGAMCDELDATMDFLHEVARLPGLDDEHVARVHEIAARTYVDTRGERQPFLTTGEVDNLTIRRGTLNEAEWENMRSHAQRSEDYLARIPWGDELKQVPCIAGAHHEKLDGTGYPDGLKAAEILPQVRMLTIADIFDALTASDRPYRKAATPERAVDILFLEANDGKLDLDMVEVFAKKVVPTIRGVIPSLNRA